MGSRMYSARVGRAALLLVLPLFAACSDRGPADVCEAWASRLEACGVVTSKDELAGVERECDTTREAFSEPPECAQAVEGFYRCLAEASCVEVREDTACDELEMEVFDGEVCAQTGMEQVRR